LRALAEVLMADAPSLPLDDLRLALAEADRALAEGNTTADKRIATELALAALDDFLKSVGLRSSALHNLSMAWQDIERGHSPTLFARSTQNRPKDEGKLVALKATAAAAMQLLMDAGKRKTEAADIVATKLDLAGFQLSGLKPRPASPRTIAQWRDKFSGHSNEEGADAYKCVLEEADPTNADRAQRAELVMRSFKRFVENLD
jgi:hypothetical protein